MAERMVEISEKDLRSLLDGYGNGHNQYPWDYGMLERVRDLIGPED